MSNICGTFVDHILSNEWEKFQVFNGVYQLALIMNTNVFLRCKQNGDFNIKGVLCAEFSKFQSVSKVQRALIIEQKLQLLKIFGDGASRLGTRGLKR